MAILVGALLTLSAWAIASARPAQQATTNVAPGIHGVADDDGEHALFTVTGMRPGHAESRCIIVSNDSAEPAGIRLSGHASGGLAAYLRLSVDFGTGGQYGDCTGFDGTPIYEDGLVVNFVAKHHDYDSGLVAHAPGDVDARTYRLRVELVDVPAAQGGFANAGFSWETRDDAIDVLPPPPPPDPAPAPAPAPAADPVPDPPPVEDDKPTVKDKPKVTDRDPEPDDRPRSDTPNTGTPDPPADPNPAPAPTGPGGAVPADPPTDLTGVRANREAGKSPTKKRATPSKTASKPPAVVQRPTPRAKEEDHGFVDSVIGAITDAIKKVVAPVVQRTAFPLILLILGGLFLLIQNRIDSRDPKLARAPLHAQPDLPFLPPPFPGDDRP